MTRRARQAGLFSPIVMIALALVGAFAFAAFFTLSAFAPELSSGRDARAHALSQSAVGYAGAVRLARARGIEVSIGRTIGEATRLDALVVLTPEHRIELDELEDASGWTTLVVLPKWLVGPHPTRRGWVAAAGPMATAGVSHVLEGASPGIRVARDDDTQAHVLQFGKDGVIESGPIARLQTISGPEIEPVIVDDQQRIVLGLVRPRDAAPFYILSDPDFLNTHGLANYQTALAGMRMLDFLRRPGDPIIFDVTLNGLGAARSALRLAFQPPFLGATLALGLAVVLLGWRAASRFGPAAPARRAIPPGKAALAENSAALIRLHGREARMGKGYAELVAADLVQNTAGGRIDAGERSAWLDRLAQSHNVSPPFSVLAAEAERASTPAEMLSAAQKLQAWKEEIERATR